jgi:hypothetical protein
LKIRQPTLFSRTPKIARPFHSDPIGHPTNSKTISRTGHASLLLVGQPAAKQFGHCLGAASPNFQNFRHQKDRHALQVTGPGINNCCPPTLRDCGRYFWDGGYRSVLSTIDHVGTRAEDALERFPKCERLDIWCRLCWPWWDWPVLRTSALCRAVR